MLGQSDEVPGWLRAADLFALASEREGMPNSVLEAMATGLPVVLTPFAGLSDDFGVPGEHYELAQRSSSAVAQAIEGLLEDAPRRRERSLQARRLMEKTMDLDHCVGRYAELYHELAR
jgi:glycosyltransferase involved in cell wall biosynthesis